MVSVSAESQALPTINIWQPDIAASGSNVTYVPKGTWLETIQAPTSLSFTRQANGGFWSADITLVGRQLDIEEWLMDGLARHIEIYNDSLTLIWEGFVSEVSANLGDLALTRGPLSQVANRVMVQYAPLNLDTAEPVTGATTTTTVADNDTSKLKYGIWEQVLSGGALTDDNATYARATYLAAKAEPPLTKSVSIPGGDTPTVTLTCLGYIHFLKNYVYNQTATTGTVVISDTTGSPKLHAVLDADPNGLFASTNATLTQNLTLVPAVEDTNQRAWGILMGMVSLGDATGDRYFLSVGANRHVAYTEAPNAVKYWHRLTDPRQAIVEVAGSTMRPWDVQAGEWMMFPDFLVGQSAASDLYSDPRTMLVETVSYSAPYDLSLESGSIQRIDQLLARWGLSGGSG